MEMRSKQSCGRWGGSLSKFALGDRVAEARVRSVEQILSLHLGPSEVLLAITLKLRADLSAEQLRQAAQEWRQRIEADQPVISHVFFRLAK
jgi:hypothetical protein